MAASASRHRILFDAVEGEESAQRRVDSLPGREREGHEARNAQLAPDVVERARLRPHPRERLAIADAEVEVSFLALGAVGRNSRIERLRHDVHRGEGLAGYGLRAEPGGRRPEKR